MMIKRTFFSRCYLSFRLSDSQLRLHCLRSKQMSRAFSGKIWTVVLQPQDALKHNVVHVSVRVFIKA